MTAAARLRVVRQRADRLERVEALCRTLETERRMDRFGHPRPRSTAHRDDEPASSTAGLNAGAPGPGFAASRRRPNP
jgi:hypothetical protein